MYSVQNPTYQAGMQAGLEVRFARAARHSRMVRALRIAVPAVVGLVMAALIAIAVFNPFRALAKLPLDMDNLVVSGTKITMEAPHLSGFTPDNRPYEMQATTATQDITDPDHVELHTLRAKVLMEDRSTVTLNSRTGLFDTKTQMLDLHKDILMRSSTGYEARLTHALVDMGQGTVTSDQPVDVKLLNGTLTADTMKVTEKGDVVRFENNVVMHLVMDRPLPTAEPAAAEETAPPPAGAKRTHTSRRPSHIQRNSGGETK
ncbi:LPS export ABC transporter periplasmic protein LptC [Nitrobacter sp. NHB1]|uniref:LPS export ABC transporter periplasmic protein LptC n=1 Tax=Nitrobacter sp. NHB1 TaxID=3119830 RepID=UPI00300020EB